MIRRDGAVCLDGTVGSDKIPRCIIAKVHAEHPLAFPLPILL